MKIIDVPQAGKRGINVSQGGRYGQVSRALVIPTNPRTEYQLERRQWLGNLAINWRSITEAQRIAWNTAAGEIQSRPVLGQSGPLTGEQFYIRTNLNLLIVGEPQVAVPPTAPSFDSNVVQSLELTNTSGTVAIKVVCSGSSDAFNLIYAAPPKSAGRFAVNDFYFLGELPEVSGGKADLTALYTAKFGAPAVGKKVFIRTKQVLDGFADIPHQFSGVVPASS